MSNDDGRYKNFRDLGRILQLFEGPERGERGVSDIAKTLGMLPSTASRMLKVLEAEGLFERDPETKKYSLGARFLQMGLQYVMNHPLRRLIVPHLEESARDLALSASWAISRNGKVIIVDRVRIAVDPVLHLLGSEAQFHSTAYGKLFFAFMTPEEQERLLKSLEFARLTSRTITDGRSMRKELARVRNEGYAFDDGETRESIRALAAPVFDARGNLVAVFGIAGAKAEIPDSRLPELVSHVTQKGLFISRQLGYISRG